jgi:antitoxin VapB
MALNIKNSGVEGDVRRLAELTGESLTSAVQAAVREKIARLEQGENRHEPLEEHLAALRPLQAALKAQQLRADDPRTARQLIQELYDEHGLPK